MRQTDSPTQLIFSVIVPTHGRPTALARCVRALERLDYPADRFEVIVVDDGSPEPVELAPEAVSVRVIGQPNAGPAAARNAGARIASGRYLAFTDDDCEPRPGWLKGFAEVFARSRDHLLGGRTVNALPDNVFASTSQHLIDYLYEYYDGRAGRTRFFTTNNMAVERARFLDRGGFDTRFRRAAGEDREFCHRWSQGGGATFVPGAVVEHAHDLKLRGFLRQHFNYGRGAYAFRDALRDRDVPGVRPEPASFYLGLIRYPLGRNRRGRQWLEAALIAGTQAANAAGFWREMLAR